MTSGDLDLFTFLAKIRHTGYICLEIVHANCGFCTHSLFRVRNPYWTDGRTGGRTRRI